jgi:hypothetical protein
MTNAARPACTTPPSEIVAQYEVLRAAALGAALPLSARSGLILFLRRDMWGWTQALSAAASPLCEQADPSSPAWPEHRRHSAIVHVLAAIVTSPHDWRVS